MGADFPTGFPLPAGTFSGGSALAALTANGKLEDLLNALVQWIGVRGIVDAPADLAAITSPGDGWMVVVRESAGAGTPPALYTYDADSASWKNLLSTGLPASHAATHKHGGADEVATAAAAANAIPKAGAGAKLDISWLPVGAGATDVCSGNDARLSDARTPTAHAGTHNPGGSDYLPVAPMTPGAYPYVIPDAAETVLAAGSVGGNAVNLPASATTAVGRKIRVVNYVGGGAVNVTPNGTDTINGVAAAHALAAQWDSVTLEYVGGGDWLITATT